MAHRTAREGHRILVSAPYGRDADAVTTMLRGQGYDVQVCASVAAIAAALDEHVGVILVTEEALHGDLRALREALDAQPPWSDIPFVVLAAPRTGRLGSAAVIESLGDLANNFVVLDRPTGKASLVSATTLAMRSRQRQFEMRDRVAELDASRAALAASEAELRLIADSLPVLIGFVDRTYRYRFANQAYEDWFYMPPEQVVGREVREIVGSGGFEARYEAMARALAGESVRMELPWPHRDGRRRDAEIRYLPRWDAKGEIDGFHVFVLDITDRKITTETLEQRVAERTATLALEAANREKVEAALRQSQKMEAVGQLTGGIAHDFNNMLTGIMGSLEVLKRRIATGNLNGAERFMDAALVSAQRAAGLTSRLLAFSRRQSLDPQPLDVNELLHSLEELVQRSIRENISLRVIAGEGLPRAVADANQLESAILNLAINARDAMPDGGVLTIETSAVEIGEKSVDSAPDLKPGRYVMVSVSDTGVGIAPEILDKIFEPFFTTKPIGQGTGLGLSMVYGFARQSGGQVRAHSAAGEGTSMKIYLPATDAPDEKREVAGRPRAQGDGQTVLLVEDDLSVRLLVSEVLGELSYATIEAGEAGAAVAILQSDRHIDLMVSDVGLPGMNGRQLAEIARQHRPGLPILFITGYAENAAIRAGFLGTNMAMITKPFALDVLAAKINEMIRDTLAVG